MIDMQLNFYSGFSAVIWSSIFISVLYLFRRTMPKTNFLGFSSLIALYLCGVLRIFFPFELPHTTIIDSYSMRMYAAFWDWLFYKKFFIPFLSPVFCCSGIFTNIFACHEAFASMQRLGMSAQTNNSKKSKRKASTKCVQAVISSKTCVLRLVSAFFVKSSFCPMKHTRTNSCDIFCCTNTPIFCITIHC